MNKNKGFTLIELLVVIAIIGILSSVVLASLSSARNKGKDVAVKSQLSSMRAQAEIFYSKDSSYASICTTDSAVTTGGLGGTTGLLAATVSAEGVTTTVSTNGTVGSGSLVSCNSTADAWAVEAPLVADTANAYYCVDSTGASKGTSTVLAANGTVCL
jgi:prepilin-type N-terminal cleavage/methylation domain-containing protein